MTTSIQAETQLIPSEDNPMNIRFGIIGCTETASTIIRAIRSLGPNDATVVAVGSDSHHSAAQFITDNQLPGDTIALGSYDAVVNLTNVDAVFVSLVPAHTFLAVAAATKGKHVLLETPTAPCMKELADILEACEDNRVQFMDSTMWLHDSRTKKMEDIVTDKNHFGKVRMVRCICTSNEDYDVLQNSRLHALGVLSHAGWYCISVILWANSYELPQCVRALYSIKNASGILVSCGALLQWPKRVATLHCSYMAHLTRQTTVIGTKGTVEISVEPYGEGTARFQRVCDANFTHLTSHNDTKIPDTDQGITEPKEVKMAQNFVRLVRSIKTEGAEPDRKWHDISGNTLLVIAAVMKSVANGGNCVEITPPLEE